MSHRPRPVRLLAAAAALLFAVPACSGGSDRAASTPAPKSASGSASSPGASTGGVPGAAAPHASVPADLERFYTQRPSWSACGEGVECARVQVPLDYRRPAAGTVRLSVVRRPAGDSGARLGSLVVNPGGPGQSGVGYARRPGVVSEAVLRRYDLVGFDPRGVGESDPLRCLDDRETDAFLGADPTPDDDAEVQTAVTELKRLAARCKARGGQLLAHVGTADAAHDMDVLRAVLGDGQLNFLGKSYGTYLGATYAEEFPRNVGRFVLDGALDPALDGDQINLGQARGFELATRSFVTDCVSRPGCPLGSTVDGAMTRLRAFLHELDAQPLRTRDASRPLTEGRGSLGVAAAMYDERFWLVLRQALQQAMQGDGSTLLALADAYTSRGPGGFLNNSNTVIFAVNCLDHPDQGGLAAVERSLPRYTQAAPTWGQFLAWSGLPCAYWPVKGPDHAAPIRAAGSGPIVVVGTIRDPATPYAWAQALARELENGHLITWDGDGHTAYRRGSTCVDDAVDAYLLRGQVPRDGLRCG